VFSLLISGFLFNSRENEEFIAGHLHLNLIFWIVPCLKDDQTPLEGII